VNATPDHALASGKRRSDPTDAQWLDLRGVAGDLPRTTELTIRGLQLAGGEPQ